MTRWCGACIGFLLLTFATFCAPAAGPKRVLIVNSFGSASSPFTTHSIAFETELTEKLGQQCASHSRGFICLRACHGMLRI